MLQVLAWGAAVVLFALIAVLVLLPRVTGATPYTIETGSMADVMPPGTVVVVRPQDFDRIQAGQIVTYQLRSGERDVVTHRVVSIDIGPDGERTLRTQGDENDTPDIAPVRAVQVRGVAWYWVPYVGYLGAFGTGEQRGWIAQGIGALLVGYAVVLVVTGIVRRHRRAASEGRSDAGVDRKEDTR